jgi:hypothetical protein
MPRHIFPGVRSALGLLGLAALLSVQACNDILKVTDPDIILEANSAAAALALKNGVLIRLQEATNGTGGNGPDALFAYSGLLTDEYRSGDTFVQRNDMDQRIFDPNNTFLATPFRSLNRARVQGEAAISALRTYVPTPASNIGLMFAVIAYAENLAGELYCNGIPQSRLEGNTVVYGEGVSVDSVFALAVATADSAVLNLAGPDSARVRQLAAVVKGRALLNRGQFAAAAAAVADVSTTFRYEVTHSANTHDNTNWLLNASIKRYSIGDNEGVNGLFFATANDPRLPRLIGGPVFDSQLALVAIREGIWGQYSPIAVATGIEARLIEAEAQLQPGGDPNIWRDIINTLRTDATLYPTQQPGFTAGAPLANLSDPGSTDGRVDVMFSERAFWMFSTGHRLGDLRRLVRQYGRSADDVFPTGTYFKGGLYGSAVNLPIPFDEQNNPLFKQCTDRNP